MAPQPAAAEHLNKELIFSVEKRAATIEACLKSVQNNVYDEKERAIHRFVKEACVFVSPIVEEINRTLERTSWICKLLSQYAQDHAEHLPLWENLTYQSHDPNEDYEARRKQKIDDNITLYLRDHKEFFKQMASRLPTIVKAFNLRIALEVIPVMLRGCKIIAQYKASSHSIPKKVTKDLQSYLKYSSELNWNEYNLTKMLYSCEDDRKDFIYDVLDCQEYEDYLNWEGTWKKARPIGKYYPKRSAYLASVVSWLLNHDSQPVYPTPNLTLSPIPIKIAVLGSPLSGKTTVARRIAEIHGLQILGLPDLYRMYTEAYHQRQTGGVEDLLIRDIADYSQIIANSESQPLTDDLNVRLLMHFFDQKQHSVRGFVLDGFPETIEQLTAFRNAIDTFDTDIVLMTHKRQKSVLLGDPIDLEPPVLPHCLLDVLVRINVPEEESFQRLRELEYRRKSASDTIIKDVNMYPFEEQQYVQIEKRILQWVKATAAGNSILMSSLTKNFLEVDGCLSNQSQIEQIEEMLNPVIQSRFDDTIRQPDFNLLKGLVATDLSSNENQPQDVEVATEEQPNEETAFAFRFVKVDLSKETSPQEVNQEITRLRNHVETKLTDVNPSRSVDSDNINYTTVENQSLTQVELINAHADFVTFVTGKDPRLVPLIPSPIPEEPKKDPKDNKKGDKSKKEDAAKTAKQSPDSALKKPGEEELDEFRLVKPKRYPRNLDYTNPTVSRYSRFFGTVEPPHKDLYDSSESATDDNDSDRDLDRLDKDVVHEFEENSEKLKVRASGMNEYFRKKNKLMELAACGNYHYVERMCEKRYLEDNLGTFYENGYPVMRLHKAEIFYKDAQLERRMMRILDQNFPVVFEPQILPEECIADLGDSNYRRVIGMTVNDPSETLDSIALSPQLKTPFIKPPLNQPQMVTLPPIQPTMQTSAVQVATEPLKFDLFSVYRWMADRWRAIEKHHAAYAKQVFRITRTIQEDIIFQVEKCKKDYFDLSSLHAIHFQAMLFNWQNTFNAIEKSKRTKTQYKELMHSQVNEFGKSLTEEINNARQRDTQLYDEIMHNGWLQDRIAMLINYFIGLMQVELDATIDGFNFLRDFICITEFKLIGTQNNTPVATIPYIDLAGLEKENKHSTPNTSPSPGESKKGKNGADKGALYPGSTIKILSEDPVLLPFLSRKTFVVEAQQRAESSSSDKRGQKSDRRSQLNVDMSTTRKRSKTQAASPHFNKDDLEELMLKDLFHKAKDFVVRLREHEEEIRRAKYNVKLPEEQKKPTTQKLAASDRNPKVHTASIAQEAAFPPVKIGHELALEEETNHLLLRLESIYNYAMMMIADSKKLTRTMNQQISASIEAAFRMESSTASMLIEYIHGKVENEEPIEKALVFHENQFLLSPDLWMAKSDPESPVYRPMPERNTINKEFQKYHQSEKRFIYEDLQKCFLAAVEKGFGEDLVDRGWLLLDSDELLNAANVLLRPPNEKVPDGVDVQDIRISSNDLLKILSNSPRLDLKK